MAETHAAGLDELLNVLARAIDRRPADAIDAELARSPRATAVQSLAGSEELEAFRQEAVDGLIRVDTANQLFRLIAVVVERLL